MKFLLICGGLLLAALAANGREKIFNSGFELGMDGFTCNQYLRPDTNPDLIYDGPVADFSDKAEGKASLRIPNRFSEHVDLRGAEIELKPATRYRCSVWAKSKNPRTITYGVTGTHPKYRWDSHHRKIEVGPEWRNFSFEFTTKPQPFHYYN